MSDTFDYNDFLPEYEDDEDVICVTKDGRKIKLSEIKDNHLINRIKYFKRKLENKPSEGVYMGDSDAAQDAVDSFNNHNEIIAEEITLHIREMEKEAKKRKLEI